jgi:hypothetical protein
MNWKRILAAERKVTIVGSISLASSGCYTILTYDGLNLSAVIMTLKV